jgi:hypothetical protein
MSWQPIETAPKDGSCFLGVQSFADGDAIYSVCLYYGGRFESADDGEDRRQLTHWMTLPEPPRD